MMQDREKKEQFVFSIQLIDAWKLNMTYLLEAKIFIVLLISLSVCFLFPTTNEMLEELVCLITYCCVTVLLKSCKSFNFFSLPA